MVYYVYHKDEKGLTVLALLEDGYNKSMGFAYIDHIRKDVLRAYPPYELADKRSDGLNEFRPMIKTLTENYNNTLIDKSKLVLDEVNDLKDQVSVNLNKLFERNKQMDELNSQVDMLSESSSLIMQKVNLNIVC